MKTLEQLHKEILASEELKQKFFAAADSEEKVVAFLKENGAEATFAEFADYMKSLENKELDDDEVEAVAGGKDGTIITKLISISTMSLGIECAVEAIKSAVRSTAKDCIRDMKSKPGVV